MKEEILINNIKFWVDQNIIYCKLYNDSVVDFSCQEYERLFCKAISILSDGSYLPVIFDLKEVSRSVSVKLFKFLSNNCKIRSCVLSKVFLVKNFKQKILLSYYVMFSDSKVPNSIFIDSGLAERYSHQYYDVFNSISCEI
ncbi:hypothetical protein KO494_06435 [Lacinutrix sp. C3R15]|uniref:hypothetical protein n=1 Tax=Flavobacteriaceae TaxID=49546 RepID=UPI001C0854D2|nr:MULTISPECIES: hypothetical protein [Flavobacteriaceae]MBU2939172.1 hypothetical protein [Lacinutrix sp. C3R15]MDO6622488.1 hypothetical protein [Oceanihabitans sp. 1_MG-2023]